MAIVEGGIEPERVGDLTFREIDYIFQARRSRMDHDWSQTRLIVAALTGKNPKRIVRLSSEALEPIEWTPELAQKVLKHFKVDGTGR